MPLSSAANKAKTKWNSANYDQVKISINPVVASSFRAACAAAGVSIASVLSQFMVEYTATEVIQHAQHASKKTLAISLSTRKKRSSTVRKLIYQLEQVREAEEQSMENIPENLRSAGPFEEAEERIHLMDEAIEILEGLY